jgi:hypothetical protein
VAALVTKLLNICYGYARWDSDEERKTEVGCTLASVASTLRTRKPPASAAEWKETIVKSLNSMGVTPPATVNAFSLDAPNNTLSASELKKSTNLHKISASSERTEIAALRSKKTKDNGWLLAEAAIGLWHKIHWLVRGHEAFLGTSTDTHPYYGKGVNHFALWLQGMELDGFAEVRMNCWESVFYTAYKADLISRGVARGLFADASHKGQVAIGEDNRLGLARNEPPSEEFQKKSESAFLKDYVGTMFRHLKGPEAVLINRSEDTPKKGDLVFIGEMCHVCICVGKQREGNVLLPHVMSLWTQDMGRYTLLPFVDLCRTSPRLPISIHPCPF